MQRALGRGRVPVHRCIQELSADTHAECSVPVRRWRSSGKASKNAGTPLRLLHLHYDVRLPLDSGNIR